MRVPSSLQDQDAKVTIVPLWAVVCTECGIVASNPREGPLRDAGFEKKHKDAHTKTAQDGREVLQRVRRAAAGRKKMASEDMCQCPCWEDHGCHPEVRSTVVQVPDAVVGVPPELYTCDDCGYAWEVRLQELDGRKNLPTTEDVAVAEEKTALEWNDLDEEQKIFDWDGFEDLKITDKITHADFVKRRQHSSCTYKKPYDEERYEPVPEDG